MQEENSAVNLQKEDKEKDFEDYNDYIVDLVKKPKNWGKPAEEEISVSQSYTGPCGDTMQFFLKIKNNIIEKANFVSDGCVASVAAASQTTLLIEGRSIDFAENLKSEDVDKALKGLPEDHKHCTDLAVRTLKRVLTKYKNRIWQEIYE